MTGAQIHTSYDVCGASRYARGFYPAPSPRATPGANSAGDAALLADVGCDPQDAPGRRHLVRDRLAPVLVLEGVDVRLLNVAAQELAGGPRDVVLFHQPERPRQLGLR